MLHIKFKESEPSGSEEYFEYFSMYMYFYGLKFEHTCISIVRTWPEAILDNGTFI